MEARPLRRALAAALTGGLVVLVAGCGGGEPAVRAPAGERVASVAGVEALSLERFHYEASLTLREAAGAEDRKVAVATEGDFQAPDRHAFTYLTGLGESALSRSAVIIGDHVWLRNGSEPWRELARDHPEVVDLLSVAFSAIRPRFLGGPEFDQVRQNVRRLPSTEEFVNDVPASHYRVDAAELELLGSVLANEQLLEQVRDLHWELWLAAEGAWPVRLLAGGTITGELPILADLDLDPPVVWELRVDISRPNDPALTVEPPRPGG